MSERAVFEAWALRRDDFGGLMSFGDMRVDLHDEAGARRVSMAYGLDPVRVRVTVEVIDPSDDGPQEAA